LNRLMQRSTELLEKLEMVDASSKAEVDSDKAKFYKQLMETFDAFDNSGDGELQFPEYKEAWRFLNQPGTDRDIKNAFDSVDVDRSGLVDRDEFVLSIMGPESVKFGPIADMDKLDSLIDAVLVLIDNHKHELASNLKSADERELENARLLSRMKNQRNELTSGMNKIVRAMMGLTGTGDVEGFLQSKEVDKYLVEAFNKYDKNGNGTLSYREFKQAWQSMNLGGSDEEIKQAFQSVDSDYSGLIEWSEFSKAIKESRLSELGIQAILGSIGVEMDNVLAKFQRDKGNYDAMQATMRRRAQRSREMQETVGKLLGELLSAVGDKVEIDLPERDPQRQQMYNDLLDTFKAFDRDNNAYLIFSEYQEAWRFLNLPGDSEAVKTAFDNVDIDRSGTVDINEFLFSIMGQEAANYGYLADMERLEKILQALLHGEHAGAKEKLEDILKQGRAKETQIQQLQAELERIRNAEGGKEFNDLIQRMMFKCGVTRIGPLTNEELVNEIDSAYASSSSAGVMDRKTFHEVINSKKMMELRLRKLISEISADYWMESRSPYGGDDEELTGRDLTVNHTADEAIHLRSFLRTSALVIQFCRRIQNKFSHGDIEGSVKAAKALSHLLTRSQEELNEEVQRVEQLNSEKRFGSYGRGHRKQSDYMS